MDTRFLLIAVFVAGVSSGWLGKAWWGTPHSGPTTQVSDNTQQSIRRNDNASRTLSNTLDSTITRSSDATSINIDFSDPPSLAEPSREARTDNNAPLLFTRLLDDRRYYDAMVLYQETTRNNERATAQLKRELLDHLNLLSSNRNNSDFSELTENYLSVYYDDLDVLLLLADFNEANGSYLEAADVYLLAKNYTYKITDQQNLLTHFNSFVNKTDQIYSNQQDWLSLINFYAHIEALGLLTSVHQYGRAIAHLSNGDRFSAVALLEQLVNDSLIGEQASLALLELSGNTGTPIINSDPVREDSEVVSLQQRGNQFLVDLTINREDNVKLLIDTGASMTTLSQASFYALRTSGEAIEQERRVFHTANGVAQGTVYLVPEINLGPFLLKNTRVAVLEFGIVQGIDGLLGMNVLGQFRFQIDQENRNLLLNKKE